MIGRLGQRLRRGGLMACALGASSCFTPPDVKTASGSGEEPSDGAILEGFVVELDGVYTRTDGQPITLTPGCHIAKTTADSVLEDRDGVVVTWKQVPVVYFRIDAVAGHRYRVDRSITLAEGRYNVLLVVLRTFDANGVQIAQQKIAYGVDGDKQRPSCSGT